MIELLVFVAIIGMVAVIISVGISISRNKANDTKVKSQLASLVRAIAIYGVANNNDFGIALDCQNGVFADTSSDIASFVNTANYPTGTEIVCSADINRWAVSASLSSKGEYWCVDSEDKVQRETSHIITSSCS